MILNVFETQLKNIANDKMQMSYGNNYGVVNGLLAIVSALQTLSSAVQAGGMNDMFSMSVNSKITELESMVAMLGGQRLMSCGINVQPMMGGMGTINPFMANTPMYNQQFPMMGFNPMMGASSSMFQPMQQMQQQMPQMMQQMPQQMQQMQQMQQQMQAPMQMQQSAPPMQAAPAYQAPAPAPIKMPAPQPQAPSRLDEPVANRGGGGGGAASDFALPGMGGGADEAAAGRDYLLKLLSEK